MLKTDVKNLPKDIRKYVVARIDKDTRILWFWGSYDDQEKAEQVAREIDGTVIENGDM